MNDHSWALEFTKCIQKSDGLWDGPYSIKGQKPEMNWNLAGRVMRIYQIRVTAKKYTRHLCFYTTDTPESVINHIRRAVKEQNK